MSRPVARVQDPYAETDVHYLVTGAETMSPDIVEVEKGTPGSFRTLQDAKTHTMRLLRDRIEEGMDSLDRVRAIGVEIRRLM
jgi:hypothetical protein